MDLNLFLEDEDNLNVAEPIVVTEDGCFVQDQNPQPQV